MQQTTTPYEAALRLRVGYGHARPRDADNSGSSPYRRRTIRPDGTPDWHLMIVLEGNYIVSPDSKHAHILEQGQAVMYPPHMKQDYMLHPDFQEGRMFWAHFFPEVAMRPFLNWPAPRAHPGILQWNQHNILNQQILDACEKCVYYYNSDYIRHRSLSLLSLEEILRLIHQVHPSSKLKRLDDRIAITLQYIANNIHSQFSIKDIAGFVGLSVSRLSHLFSKNMHIGIMEYVEKQRVNMACSMLTNTDLSVADIAEKCGFSSSYYFSKRFRKHHAITPTQYRNGAED